jgi:hypothetical protein
MPAISRWFRRLLFSYATKYSACPAKGKFKTFRRFLIEICCGASEVGRIIRVSLTNMLSPQQLRKIDPTKAHLSDEEIVEIRDAFYDLGQLIFDDWLENTAVSKYPVGVLQGLKESNKIKACKPPEPKLE